MIDTRFYILAQSLKLGDLASTVRAVLPHAKFDDESITAPAALANSQASEISFFSNKRLKDDLESAGATACFTTDKLADLVAEKGIIPLVVDNPRAAFARLSDRLVTPKAEALHAEPTIDPTADIHPMAVISRGCHIGKNSQIGAHCYVGPGVQIGANCCLKPNVTIEYAIIGDSCTFKPGAVVGGAGFGVVQDEGKLLDIPHLGRVVIGSHVNIGSNSCVDRGQLGDTELHDHVRLDNLVQIGHNVVIGEASLLAGHVGVSGSCVIGKGCQLGGRVGLADHIKVGDGATLAAFAGVMQNVPAGEMYSGLPSMPIREHMRSIAAIKKLGQRKPKS